MREGKLCLLFGVGWVCWIVVWAPGRIHSWWSALTLSVGAYHGTVRGASCGVGVLLVGHRGPVVHHGASVVFAASVLAMEQQVGVLGVSRFGSIRNDLGIHNAPIFRLLFGH